MQATGMAQELHLLGIEVAHTATPLRPQQPYITFLFGTGLNPEGWEAPAAKGCLAQCRVCMYQRCSSEERNPCNQATVRRGWVTEAGYWGYLVSNSKP